MFLFVLAGCGSSGGDGGGSPATPPPNPQTNVLPLKVVDSREYLQTSQVALGDLDPSLASETGLIVTQDSGPAVQFKLSIGNVLYYLSPVEQYTDTTSTLKITNASGTKAWNLTFEWAGRVSPSLTRISEADENGTPPEDDTVTFSANGVGVDGSVSTTATKALSFILANAPGLDGSLTSISLFTASSSEDVTSWFTYDAVNSTLTLSPSKLSLFLSTLQPSKKAALVFSLSTPDYEETFGFEQILTYADGTLNVAVVNADGSPATDLAGAQFVARGFNSGTTALGQLDSHSTLSFTGLPADTFEVIQVLLGPGIRLTGVGTLPTSTSVVSLTIKAPLGKASKVQQEAAKADIVSGPSFSKEIRSQDPQVEAMFKAHLLALTAPGNDYAVTVISAAADTLITSPVNFIAPMGSTQLGIHIEVDSAEFPVFTGQQSQFNDVWMYDIQFPTPFDALQQSGKVNQTHVTTGIASFDQCLDLTAAAKNTDFPISGEIGAQNVADALFQTSVTVTISLSCTDSLNITEFSGIAKTPGGLFSLYPRRTATNEKTPDGNVAGQYLSIPIKDQLPASFGIPASLKYTPTEATITEIELFLRSNSGDVSLSKNYLTQGDTSTPGVVTFKNLLLNPTTLTPVATRVQIVAIARGTDKGNPVASQPFPVSIGKYSNFTPIYLTSEIVGYSANNRYGLRDPGGDSWSTLTMSTWLFTEIQRRFSRECDSVRPPQIPLSTWAFRTQ